jgi:glucan phosphoethanolaminetransferase (alkaline phosphatase superfamily)
VCVFTLVKTQARISHTLWGNEELCVAAIGLCVFRCEALFGATHFFILEVKEMKINGVDIEECETAILLKNYKMYLIMIPGYFLFAFFMLICSFASRSVLMEEGMGIAVLIMLIGAVVFTCVAVSFINKAKCIKAELNSRIISNAEEESAKTASRISL